MIKKIDFVLLAATIWFIYHCFTGHVTGTEIFFFIIIFFSIKFEITF